MGGKGILLAGNVDDERICEQENDLMVLKKLLEGSFILFPYFYLSILI